MRVLASLNQPKIQIQVSRRSALPIVLAPLLIAPGAKALIPDDSDEEIVEKAKLNRKARLAQDKKLEQVSAASTGNLDKELGFVIQGAVRSLALTGTALEKGDVKEAKAALATLDRAKLSSALLSLSTTKDATALAAEVDGGVQGLEGALNGGNAGAAKTSFVVAAKGLKAWANATGVAASIRGL